MEHALIVGKKHGYIRITGKTPAKDRQGLCDRFQEDKEIRAALLTINATGVSSHFPWGQKTSILHLADSDVHW